MPPRPGKPCRFQTTQATLRTPIVQQQQSNNQPLVAAHGFSAGNRRSGLVHSVAPPHQASSPPTLQPTQWTQQQPMQPIVDDEYVDQWEQEIPIPPPSVTFTDDVEDVYNSRNHSWGSWASEASASNIMWEANKWSVQPAEMPSMFDLRDLRQLGVPVEASEQQSPTPPPVSVASEDDPRRFRFHSALYSAAMQPDVAEVQKILQSMSDEGLPPGPAALHSLVFAHVKAGQSEAALQAARDIVGIGLPLLEETYIALVYGLVEEGKVELAEGVILSMYNAGGTTRHGWLALTKGLFRKGNNVTVAFQHLQKGLQEGWNPDASLFEYVIRAFCVADNMEQAQRVLASMPDLGCPPRTVHINLLVELVARLEGLEAALEYIENTFTEQDQRSQVELGAKPAPKAEPNNDTFCAVFRGIFHNNGRDMEAGTSVENFAKITSAMMTSDLLVGPKILVYGLEWFLMDGELESGLEQISALRTVAGEGWTEHVEDRIIVALLTACGSSDRPLDLAVLLRELNRRNRQMSCAVMPTEGDSAGRPVSALTSWLLPRVPEGPEGDNKGPMQPDSDGEEAIFGSFSSKTARIFEQADIANFDGVLRTIDVEVKPEKTTKDDEVIPSVIKTALIGIGQCVVTEDGVPLKLNAMLKWHLLAELKARGFNYPISAKAAELKAEVKLQRGVLEPHIDAFHNKQSLEGGMAMSRVQSLIASGMSHGNAMAHVREKFSSQAVERMSVSDSERPPTSDAAEDFLEEQDSKDEDEEDEYGVDLKTPIIITEYSDWNCVMRRVSTYGQLNEEERKSYRTMEKYTSPKSNAKSVGSRRTEALDTVMDEARSELDGGTGWQSDLATNGGLLSQFEGDLHLGEGEGDEGETSLSDGVGSPHSDAQDDASGIMMEAGSDDDSAGVVDLEQDEEDEEGTSSEEQEDDDAAIAELASGDDAEDPEHDVSSAENRSVDEGDGVDGDLLEDGESDDEEEAEESRTLLDLTGFTNDSAGVEVAVECLRCARCIGLVISSGDFESTLTAAKRLKSPEYMVLLHGWALEQATEVITGPEAAELDGDGAAAVQNFSREFCEKTRQALLEAKHPAHAVSQLAAKEGALMEV